MTTTEKLRRKAKHSVGIIVEHDARSGMTSSIAFEYDEPEELEALPPEYRYAPVKELMANCWRVRCGQNRFRKAKGKPV
jgi:hypothetical protein